MRSKERVEPLDSFEDDVRVTLEDCQAQARLRDARTMTTKQYLDWCSVITRDTVSHATDHHSEVFELD